MRRLGLLGGLCLIVLVLVVPVNNLFAQMALSIRVEASTVLQFEPLQVYLTLLNNSGVPFVVNCDDPRNMSSVDFRIERGRDLVSRINNQIPVVDNLRVMPDEKREIMLDLSHSYNIGQMGTYLVSAVVNANGKEMISGKIAVDVVRGIELDSLRKSAPGHYDGEREYTLLYWNRKGVERLFLRVDGVEDSTNYGVFDLGILLRVLRPSVKVDRKGNIEVFHQSTPSQFLLTSFSSTYDGLVFVDQESRVESVRGADVRDLRSGAGRTSQVQGGK